MTLPMKDATAKQASVKELLRQREKLLSTLRVLRTWAAPEFVGEKHAQSLRRPPADRPGVTGRGRRPRMTTAKYGVETYEVEPAEGLPDYLVRVIGLADRSDWITLACDYVGCFALDYEDVMDGTSSELRPIYLDTRHEVRICQKCVDVGRHLDPE